MTRRLTLALVGIVAATLLITGFGMLVLARVGAGDATERDLRRQAADVADSLGEVDGRRARRVAGLLRQALELDDIRVVLVSARGAGELPAGVAADDLPLDRLLAGDVVSGRHGDLIYAASTFQWQGSLRAGRTPVVVLTERLQPGLGPATRWFVGAAAGALALAAVVAVTLGRGLTKRLRAAEAATRRIAAGDLATRVPVAASGDGGTRDEVTDLSHSINTMADALARSRVVEQQFLLSVSHDLRTPLTSIRGYAEAIADGAVLDDRVAAGVILSEARRLERLVRDLLDLAKLETRQFSLVIEPVDLAAVAAGTAEGFQPEAEEAGVVIEVRATDSDIVVAGDADRLAQVVANLIENALKFATTLAVIEVAVVDGQAVLAASDDGPGIAAEDLPHVFERLYVARSRPARKESGSGLGLAIVRELVTAMGGTVTAEPSAPSGPSGARLVVRLPLAGVT